MGREQLVHDGRRGRGEEHSVRRRLPGPCWELEGGKQQAGMLRCIFGNPFRPATVDVAWLDWNRGIVRSLAEATYEERIAADPSQPGWLVLDPIRLAILADALEDAGCTDSTILDHLRDPLPHTRGCWTLDLLLGRE
jgi:hypothetical protein